MKTVLVSLALLLSGMLSNVFAQSQRYKMIIKEFSKESPVTVGQKYLCTISDMAASDQKVTIDKIKLSLAKYLPVITDQKLENDNLNFYMSVNASCTFADLQQQLQSIQIRLFSGEKKQSELPKAEIQIQQ